MPSIADRQNDTRALLMLRAVRVANRLPTAIDSLRGLVSVGFMVASVVVALRGQTSPWLAGVGAIWAAVSSLFLKRWASARATEAAGAQEAFDLHVYDLRPSTTPVEQVLPERMHELAGRWRRDSQGLRDWYPDPGLQRPFDVLVCQRSNAVWDIRLRHRWMKTLAVAISVWLVVGLVVGLLGGLLVSDLMLRWYVPSLGAITFAVEAYRSQRTTIAAREALLARLDDALAGRGDQLPPQRVRRLLAIARDVQDGLYETRRETSRVPGWFYWWFRDRDNAAMHSVAREL